ncbi:MAG: hypothetical protein H3C51_09310 [Rubellimicrobium sp.]|nr:hypothetical protein [Rubellimicrobium sp.]
MKHIAATAGAALLMTAGAAGAAGLDRSGQPVGVLFQPGNYAELSFGFVRPDVSGTVGGGAFSSGNMAGDYSQLSFALKMDLNDRLSFAVIVDQPYGASVSYPAGGSYPLAGTTAEISSQAVTGLLRYRIDDRFSVYGGLRGVAMDGEVNMIMSSPLPSGTYNASFDRATALGYVVGVAYEIPDIALRAALTWSSATDFSSATSQIAGGSSLPPSTTEITMPQQITLDFQTGIAANTLLMAQVKWVEWTATNISPTGYPNLVHYEHDRMSYSLGIGRKFSDSFSGAITLGYEPPTDAPVLNLSGTDGQYSLQVGGTYTTGNVSFTGGLRYVWLGDATTEGLGADFRDNHAVALGLSVGYRF